jgi:hypothetical protein
MGELKASGLLDARPAAALSDFTGEAASAEPADDGEDVDGDDDADIQIDDIEAPLSDPEPEPPAPS